MTKSHSKYFVNLVKKHWTDAIFAIVIFSILWMLLDQDVQCISRNYLGNDLKTNLVCLVKGYDNPIHFVSSLKLEQIFKNGSSIFSWNQDTHTGYPTFLVYSPMSYFIVVLIDAGLRDIFLSYNIALFLVYLIVPTSLYVVLRRLNINSFISLITALIFIFYSGSQAKIFLGFWPSYLSLAFMPLILIALEKRMVIAQAVLLALSFLVHPVASLNVMLLVAAFYASSFVLALKPFQSQKIRGLMKNLIVVSIIFFGLVSWWLLPVVVNSSYLNPFMPSKIDIVNFLNEVIGDGILNSIIVSYGILGIITLIGGAIFAKFKKKRIKFSTIEVSLLVSLVFSLILLENPLVGLDTGILPNPFNFIEFNRFLIGLNLTFLLIGATAIDSVMKEIKKTYNKKYTTFLNRFHNTLHNKQKLAVLIIVFLTSFAVVAFPMISARWSNFQGDLETNYNSFTKENESMELVSVLDFLSTHAEKGCRASYFGANSNLDPTFGNLISLNMPITKEEWEALFYNNPNPQSIEDMKSLNVKYVITNNQSTLTTMGNPNDFAKIYGVGDFSIFELKDYNCSFAFIDDETATVKDVTADRSKLVFFVENATKGEKIIMKMSYFPAWSAYVGGEEVETGKWGDWNMIYASLPKDGSYYVEFTYGTLKGELEGLVISVAVLGVCILFLAKKQIESSKG